MATDHNPAEPLPAGPHDPSSAVATPSASPKPAGLNGRQPDWAVCETIAKTHGRTFYFASRFLPNERRRSIHAVYAFCRTADDIVDRAPATGLDTARSELTAWEAQIDSPFDPIAVAFAHVRAMYGVPPAPARDLIAGVRMDLEPERFATWDALVTYCYRVAGTVGLMTAPILGCTEEAALPYAVDLGIAMQLTNILRDVAEDAQMGRLYLPLDDLAAFGVDPESIMTGRPNGRFCDLMAFEIDRAMTYYTSAMRGVPALCPSGRFAVLASARLYGGILNRIEDQGYDVFAGRAHLSTRRKLRALPTVTADFFRLYLPGSIRASG